MPGQEAGHQAAERAQRLGGDGHRPLREPGGVTELVLALVELVQGPVGPDQEHRAEPVEPDPPSATVEEGDAEFGLQARDGPAQGGLGDAQFGRGPAHVLVAGDGLEVTQLEQVHIFMLAEHKKMTNRSWTASADPS